MRLRILLVKDFPDRLQSDFSRNVDCCRNRWWMVFRTAAVVHNRVLRAGAKQ
jgi:hypothetical protein